MNIGNDTLDTYPTLDACVLQLTWFFTYKCVTPYLLTQLNLTWQMTQIGLNMFQM